MTVAGVNLFGLYQDISYRCLRQRSFACNRHEVGAGAGIRVLYRRNGVMHGERRCCRVMECSRPSARRFAAALSQSGDGSASRSPSPSGRGCREAAAEGRRAHASLSTALCSAIPNTNQAPRQRGQNYQSPRASQCSCSLRACKFQRHRVLPEMT